MMFLQALLAFSSGEWARLDIKRICSVPLGGTNLKSASLAAGDVFQPVSSVVMLNSAGVPVSVTVYRRGQGLLPSAIQIWKSTPGRLNSRWSCFTPSITVLPTTAASLRSFVSNGKAPRYSRSADGSMMPTVSRAKSIIFSTVGGAFSVA